MSEHFETVTCGRCGGTGHYSYCQMYGTTCFKCRGQKVIYTKRGAVARAYFERLLSLPARELQPGMKIKAPIVSVGGGVGERWSTITAIEDNAVTRRGGHKNVNGEVVYGGLNIVSEHCTFVDVDPESVYRVAATAERKQAALQVALAYQATLTKLGKPSTRRTA